MAKFRVTGGTLVHEGKTYYKDDIVHTNAALDKAFGDGIERVVQEEARPAPAAESAPPPAGAGSAPSTDAPPKAVAGPKPVSKAALKKLGVEVTDRFPRAIDEDYRVFRRGKEYWVYDVDDLAAPVNAEPLNRSEVDATILSLQGA
jgi:hypothetical protein